MTPHRKPCLLGKDQMKKLALLLCATWVCAGCTSRTPNAISLHGVSQPVGIEATLNCVETRKRPLVEYYYDVTLKSPQHDMWLIVRRDSNIRNESSVARGVDGTHSTVEAFRVGSCRKTEPTTAELPFVEFTERMTVGSGNASLLVLPLLKGKNLRIRDLSLGAWGEPKRLELVICSEVVINGKGNLTDYLKPKMRPEYYPSSVQGDVGRNLDDLVKPSVYEYLGPKVERVMFLDSVVYSLPLQPEESRSD